MDDRDTVETQLGRPLRAASEVVSRCHLGMPVVVKVPPVLDDGTPFPTLYWLTCPLASSRIGRLEGAGGVKRLERKADRDPEFGDRLAMANEAYAAERDDLVPQDSLHRPSGGVGGTRVGVKCLHAHYAYWRGGGSTPVGEVVAGFIEPLDCEQPCVVEGEINPLWVNNP